MAKFSVPTPLPASGDRADVYATLADLTPDVDLTDDATIKTDGGELACKSIVGRWVKYPITYEDFTAAGTTESITLFSLIASGMVGRVVIDVTEAWVIATMSTLDLEIGIAGTTDKYTPSAHADAEGVGIEGFSQIDNLAPESMSAATNILVTATSDAGNLADATAGAADIYIWREDLIGT